jgi:hypothetical protein
VGKVQLNLTNPVSNLAWGMLGEGVAKPETQLGLTSYSMYLRVLWLATSMVQ